MAWLGIEQCVPGYPTSRSMPLPTCLTDAVGDTAQTWRYDPFVNIVGIIGASLKWTFALFGQS